ncbi:MAG: hypothetical protein ABEJ94_06435 [Halorientalis sp.]
MSDSDRCSTDDGVTDVYGDDLGERPFTVRGEQVRAAAVRDDGWPRSWDGVVSQFRDYVFDQRQFSKQFTNSVEPMSHRFSEQYAREKTGEVYGADRELQTEYDDLHCALVTLRGNYWNDDNEGRAPLDFLNDLLASNSNVSAAFRRHVDHDFARLTVLGAHETGYPHIHHGLWIDGAVDTETLTPAVGAHVRNSPVAQANTHDPDGGTIRVWRPDVSDERTSLASEMVSQFVGWDGILDAPQYEQRFAALLWASETRQYRPDDTFRAFIDKSQDDDHGDDPGGFEGLRVEGRGDEDDTVIPPSEITDGTVNRVKAKSLPDDLDPTDDAVEFGGGQ